VSSVCRESFPEDNGKPAKSDAIEHKHRPDERMIEKDVNKQLITKKNAPISADDMPNWHRLERYHAENRNDDEREEQSSIFGSDAAIQIDAVVIAEPIAAVAQTAMYGLRGTHNLQATQSLLCVTFRFRPLSLQITDINKASVFRNYQVIAAESLLA
jgi:hypothetical protein